MKKAVYLTTVGHFMWMFEIFPSDRMNAYPVSKEIELPGPYTIDNLKPAGEKIYTELEQKLIPHRHWGHKHKGAGSGTLRGIRKIEREAGGVLIINLLDHLILLPEGYTSMADDGLV